MIITANFKAHIFVVDDNPSMLEVVSLMIKSAKFDCRRVHFALVKGQ